MNSTKKALWLACNSAHGERLIGIAQEHVSLAKKLSFHGQSMTSINRERIITRIEALRLERDGIIFRYEQNNIIS